MENIIVRILEIQITNLKNVNNGKISFLNSNIRQSLSLESGDILGIYGQNGSGKTTVIDAIFILKNVLMGMQLNNEIGNLISYGEKKAELIFSFYIEINHKRYIAEYKFAIQKAEKNDIEITSETIKSSEYIDNNWKKTQTLIEAPILGEFINSKKFNTFFLKRENEIELIINQELARRTKVSFLFSQEIKQFLKAEGDLFNIINALTHFAHLNLFIVSNKEIGMINLNLLLPLKIKNSTSSGDFPIQIDKNENIIVNKKIFSAVESTINDINEVLKKIIPNLHLNLVVQREEAEAGEINIIADLRTIRDSKPVSLRYESEGIKRIVSILGVLIAVYNQPSVCLAIDELDAGIFEYLLGEILEALSIELKGQLIFTSHNLRILEKIDKKNIVFSTTNPKNRYVKFKYVKPNNNLRDMYLRELIVKEQKEELYKETNLSDIRRALYRVGANNEKER